MCVGYLIFQFTIGLATDHAEVKHAPLSLPLQLVNRFDGLESVTTVPGSGIGQTESMLSHILLDLLIAISLGMTTIWLTFLLMYLHRRWWQARQHNTVRTE